MIMMKSAVGCHEHHHRNFHRNRLTFPSLSPVHQTENNNTTINNNNNHSSSAELESTGKDRDNARDTEKDRSLRDKEREKNPSSDHKANSASPKRPTSRDFPPEREKAWNYPPGLDNSAIALATGAFWQNYSGTQQSPIAQQISSDTRRTVHSSH